MAEKNTTRATGGHPEQSSNPLARAVERVNLQGVFDELGLPKLQKKMPQRIRIVRKTQSNRQEKKRG